MQKLWRALAVVVMLVLLYLRGSPISEYSLPKVPWVILFILTLTYGLSLTFDGNLALPRRWGIAYLALCGFTYLDAGLLGLRSGTGLIEAAAWSSLISPYVLISIFDQLVHHFPYTIWRAPYDPVPPSGDRLYSVVVILTSMVGVLAAFAMARSLKIAYRIWLVLLGGLTVAFLGHLVVCFISWGLKALVVPLCWEASYVAAYVMARKGVQFSDRRIEGA